MLSVVFPLAFSLRVLFFLEDGEPSMNQGLTCKIWLFELDTTALGVLQLDRIVILSSCTESNTLQATPGSSDPIVFSVREG
jgi:hypothetical protein